MRRSLPLIALAATLCFAAPATTQAAPVTKPYCDTDKQTYYVKRGAIRKIKVVFKAQACISHTVDGPTVCSGVTSFKTWMNGSLVDFLDSKVKRVSPWRRLNVSRRENPCVLASEPFEVIERWGGTYRYDLFDFGFGFEPIAAPQVDAVLHGFLDRSHAQVAEDAEFIVQLRKVGENWTFRKNAGGGT